MRLMLVHRSRFDHGFKLQNAVEAAASRVSNITAHLRAANPYRLHRCPVRAQTDAHNGNASHVDGARARTHLDPSA